MKEDLKKVLRFIEENIRVTDQTTIEYLDPKGHVHRLSNKQNQIIFGRRGSGKSLLLKSLRAENQNIQCFTVNLDDFKDISFPDSIIQVLRIIIKQLKTALSDSFSFWEFRRGFKAKKINRKLNRYLKNIESRLKNPDQFDESTKHVQEVRFQERLNLAMLVPQPK